MASKSLCLAGLVALASVTCPARAEPTGDVLLAAGATYRHVTRVDLAQIGGSDDHGSDGDQSPGSLSAEIGAGLLFRPGFELRGSAWLGVGGLALAHVEERYFDSGPEQIGSSLTVGAGGSARYAPALTPGVRAFVGPAVDWKRLTAASPAGSAHLELVGVGLDAGLRFRTSAATSKLGGHLELTFAARRELPVAVWVGRSRTDVLFSGVESAGDPVYSIGMGAAYVMTFNDAL